MPARIPYVLTAFGIPHVFGYMPAKDGTRWPSPLGPLGLIDLAAELGLAGVEMPLPEPAVLADEALAHALQQHDLALVVDTPGLGVGEPKTMVACLRRAARLGARVARTTLSGILCGDRRGFPGGWPSHLDGVVARLREILPAAEELGVTLCIENHQDATTADLLSLHERSGQSPAFGVALDCGNPLAVGEEPVETAQALAPLLAHLHLKDYTIHFAPNGYRLVRCPAGAGVVDFPAILAAARRHHPDITPGIEIAAQATRTIPMLERSWWDEYPSREARDLLGALQILWREGRPADEPYGSAWERGLDSAAVGAEEMAVLRASVDYFRSLEPATAGRA
jgi:sugar phosphate isomerase/epimerase